MIAYDRLIPDQDIAYYVSFDNVKQGRVQAQTLVDKLGSGAKGKSIVMVNGAPTDPSAGDYKKGAHQVLDKSGLKIAKEFDTPDWSPDKAQTRDGAVDHRARQGRLRGRLLGERRHGGRHHRRDEGRGHRPADEAR